MFPSQDDQDAVTQLTGKLALGARVPTDVAARFTAGFMKDGVTDAKGNYAPGAATFKVAKDRDANGYFVIAGPTGATAHITPDAMRELVTQRQLFAQRAQQADAAAKKQSAADADNAAKQQAINTRLQARLQADETNWARPMAAARGYAIPAN
jgi:hypothetical protein